MPFCHQDRIFDVFANRKDPPGTAMRCELEGGVPAAVRLGSRRGDEQLGLCEPVGFLKSRLEIQPNRCFAYLFTANRYHV